MRRRFRVKMDRLLRRLHLKPLSLAEKCRLQFGAAVILSLIVALLIPYLWMNKLTEKTALDAGRAVADRVYEQHFRVPPRVRQELPVLSENGAVRDPNDLTILWARLDSESPKVPADWTESEQTQTQRLLEDPDGYEYGWIDTSTMPHKHTYVRIVRATDACLTCHGPDRPATPFHKNERLGLLLIRSPVREYAKTILINRVTTIVAGLLAGTAAMVAFYAIAQRVILRPIRQLRALANNIAEGNLDARSSIKSGDEYEKLANAFNHMLDVLQDSRNQLAVANRQLDAKITELSDRNIELFEANKLKSEFLANMTHEVRTPLNAILGFAQLLYEKPGADVEKSRRYAQNIIASGRSLLNLINDLLDLAKAEAGRMELHVEKTSIGHLCQALVDFFTPMADEKRLTLTLAVDDTVPAVYTDPGKVRQILYNYLSNAIKFTPVGGRIHVSARMLSEHTVRMAVADTGPGIAREHHEAIFEKFRQVDGSITRQGNGTGLGLAICHELSVLLAGAVSVDSEPGRGATFYLDLPLRAPGDSTLIL